MVRKRPTTSSKPSSLNDHSKAHNLDEHAHSTEKRARTNWSRKIAFALSCLIVSAILVSIHLINLFGKINPLEKSHLPVSSSYQTFSEAEWGTYRPHVYFGMKTKQPASPNFGIVWFEQMTTNEEIQQSQGHLPLRHWCDNNDNVNFIWSDHDGKSFGSQTINDGLLGIKIDWFSFGQSWTARFTTEKEHWNKTHSFIFYFALQENSTVLRPTLENNLNSGEYSIFVGQSPFFGIFEMTLLHHVKDVEFETSHLAFKSKNTFNMAHVNSLLLSSFIFDGKITLPKKSPFKTDRPNFIALQLNLRANSSFEVHFKSAADTRPFKTFNEHFAEKLNTFRQQFSSVFHISPDFSKYEPMGRAALSNMLGGVGAWHGFSILKSVHFNQPNDETKRYGPLSLLSAVPSRSFFPRGFIWDEAFHNLLIHRFDPILTLKIFGSYLDTMNIEGWIPREVVLGPESEAKIPPEFLVQSDWIANPPVFFYLIEKLLRNTMLMKKYRKQICQLYPRLHQWYLWIKKTQSGPVPGSFRWRGRNDTGLQLNPTTLSSGFDDFPRASHPTNEEYHLDLFCWMAYSSKVLRQLAETCDDSNSVPSIDDDVRFLNNIETLDSLHWSNKSGQYCDYGLHSEKVVLENKQMPDGSLTSFRKVLKEPKIGFVEDVYGYANLFPVLLKLLPANSPRLGLILASVKDPNKFWTLYGLRSLSPTSPYYNSYNTQDSGPYWRGAIWINMNYLALDALLYYSNESEEFGQTCEELYRKLRHNLITNIGKEFDKNGLFWEHYNDETGTGEGTRPFTGWTSLVLLMLTEKY